MSEPVLWAAEELSLAIGRQTLYDNAEFSSTPASASV